MSNDTLYSYCLDANDRIKMEDIEVIAYQACDKVYKKENRSSYENLWQISNTLINMFGRTSFSLLGILCVKQFPH